MSSKPSAASVIIKDFGERMREAYDNKNNAEISREMGVSESAVTNYMAGRVTLPVVMQVSEQTGFSVDWLLTGKGSKRLGDLDDLEFGTAFRNFISKLVKDAVDTELDLRFGKTNTEIEIPVTSIKNQKSNK